jgi:hypothetical protein
MQCALILTTARRHTHPRSHLAGVGLPCGLERQVNVLAQLQSTHKQLTFRVRGRRATSREDQKHKLAQVLLSLTGHLIVLIEDLELENCTPKDIFEAQLFALVEWLKRTDKRCRFTSQLMNLTICPTPQKKSQSAVHGGVACELRVRAYTYTYPPTRNVKDDDDDEEDDDGNEPYDLNQLMVALGWERNVKNRKSTLQEAVAQNSEEPHGLLSLRLEQFPVGHLLAALLI